VPRLAGDSSIIASTIESIVGAAEFVGSTSLAFSSVSSLTGIAAAKSGWLAMIIGRVGTGFAIGIMIGAGGMRLLI
jgi:hypothetical protein